MAVILQLLRELLSPELILDDPRPPTPVHVSLACQQTLPIVGVDNLYNKQTRLSTSTCHQLTLNFRLEDPQFRTNTFSELDLPLNVRHKNRLKVVGKLFCIMTVLTPKPAGVGGKLKLTWAENKFYFYVDLVCFYAISHIFSVSN